MSERYLYTKTYNNYGKVVLTLNIVLEQKNMNPYKLSRLTGINWGIIKKYVNGNLYRVDMDLLARMCYVLECPLSDIIQYAKDELSKPFVYVERIKELQKEKARIDSELDLDKQEITNDYSENYTFDDGDDRYDWSDL